MVPLAVRARYQLPVDLIIVPSINAKLGIKLFKTFNVILSIKTLI